MHFLSSVRDGQLVFMVYKRLSLNFYPHFKYSLEAEEEEQKKHKFSLCEQFSDCVGEEVKQWK